MEVSGQLHALATLRPGERNCLSHSVGGFVGSRFVLDFYAQHKHLSPLYVFAVGWTVLISVANTRMSVL